MKIKTLLNVRSWDSFLKHSGLMLLAMSVANVSALLFQLFMARNLTEIDYGILNSLLSCYIIFAITAGGIQGVVTKFVSKFHALEQLEKIEILIFTLAKRIFCIGLVLFFAFTLARKSIASFLHIDTSGYVMLIGTIVFISCLTPLGMGSLNGLQQFMPLGMVIVSNQGLKLAAGIFLVILGFKVFGALTAIVISSFTSLVLSLFFLNAFLKKRNLRLKWSLLRNKLLHSQIDFSKIYRYFWPVAVSLLSFMILTNSDVVLVKHFFAPLEAGYYSLAQVAGKIILFLPGAVSMVMFPKSSNSHAKNQDSRFILKKSLVVASVMCLSAAIIFMSFPQIIAFILKLSSEVYVRCVPLIRLFSLTMVFFALVHILIFYHLSVHNMFFIVPLTCCTLLQVALLTLWHPTLEAVLAVMCCNSIFLFLINLRLTRKKSIV